MENYTQQLLNTLKNYTGWSYYQIAKELGVSRGNVSRWKSGANGMSDENALQAGKILGIKSEIVLTQLQISKTDSLIAKRIWKKYLKQLNNQ